MLGVIKNNKGFSLVELLVAVAIFAILAAGVFRVVTSSYSNFYGTGDRQAVTEFAKEGAEAVRAIRDASWQSIEDLTEDTDTGVSQNANGEWIFWGSSDINGALTRTIQIGSVSRDASGNIVDSGGTDDPLTKKATITVSGSGIEDYVLIIYISNWATKTWLQTDWSGSESREFWSDASMVSSTTDISTSTSGQITLSEIPGTFTDSKKITIDHTQVSVTPSYFVLMVASTYDSFKTIAHGGKVTDDNGYDIIFTSDAEGLVQLDHEIESYSSSTGAIVMWVKGPSLSSITDTVLYMFYGNSDISTSQENVAAVWSSDYMMVQHFNETSGVHYDSTSNNYDSQSVNVTTQGSANGKIGGADWYDGINDYIDLGTDINIEDSWSYISFWVKLDGSNTAASILSKSTSTYINAYWHAGFSYGSLPGRSYPIYNLKVDDVDDSVKSNSSYVPIDEWTHVAYSYGNSYMRVYINGVQAGAKLKTGTISTTTLANAWIGRNPDGSRAFNGTIDELRIVRALPSGMGSEYNNQSSPETFYTMTGIFDNDYSYRDTIVIDNTKVSGSSNLTNYPLLISGTYDSLRTMSNGGKVTDDNGYDIIFTSDTEGLTQLDHEIESYSSSTGSITMWVRVPSVSGTVDTTLYMFYGNENISISQENVAGVWDANYLAVWHLNQTSGVYEDSIGNYDSTSATVTNRSVACKISLCPEFNGSGDNIGIYGGAIIAQETDYTIQAWVNSDTVGISSERSVYDESTSLGTNSRLRNTPSGEFQFDLRQSSTWYSTNNTDVASADTWYNSAATLSSTAGMKVFVNGVEKGSNVNTSPSDQTIANSWIGKYEQGGYSWDGEIDEVRLSDIARTSDWLLTEFNNQNSPETFYSLNPYLYVRSIVIDNTKVSGTTDLIDFPLLISGTYDFLATNAHGGRVYSPNGYDIVFSTSTDGSSPLAHEIESYDATNGEINMWVKVPVLDYNNDTTIYILYGNDSIDTSQEDYEAVWDNNYVAVLHMAENPTSYIDGDCGSESFAYICDSTINNSNAYAWGTMYEYAAMVDGPVGPALWFDGTADYLAIDDSVALDSATGAGQARTLSFWLNIESAVDNTIITEKSSFNGDHFWIQTQGTAGDIIGGVSAVGSYLDSNPAPGEGSWKYITMNYDGSNGSLYIDGILNNGPVAMTAPPDNNSRFFLSGYNYGSFTQASYDELRISNSNRSSDWIATEYGNMDSPSTFYSIGSEIINKEEVLRPTGVGTYKSTGSLISSVYDLGSSGQNLSTISVEQDIPTSCSAQITLKADDNSDFSTAVSENFNKTDALYVSSVSSTLDGKRWLRYEATLAACGTGNINTPTLYSVKIGYK